MARVSTIEKTLAYFKEVGNNGATIEEILRLGFHRATFFRHRKAINSNDEHYIETFLDEKGIKKYRLRSHKTTLEKFSGTVLTPDVKIGSVKMANGSKNTANDQDWVKRLQSQLEAPFQFVVDNPTYDSDLLNSDQWESLKDSIESKRAIRVHEYECPSWEVYSESSPIIFPLGVIVIGEQHYLHGMWVRDEEFIQVHLNLAGILKYSQVRTFNLPQDVGVVLPRWKWFVIGVHSLANRISSEVWHSSQIDITKDDSDKPWGQLNYVSNLSMLGQLEGFTVNKKLYDKIIKGNYKFIRLLPLVNELTIHSVNRYRDEVDVLHKG